MIHILKKAINKIVYENKLRKRFGIKLAFFQFLQDFANLLCNSLASKIEFFKHEIVKQILIDEFNYLILKYNDCCINNTRVIKNKIIWVFWGQGFEKAPEVVQGCLGQLKRNAIGYNIIELDLKNYINYIDIPDYIIKQFKESKISIVNFSDIIRVFILKKYGGIWIDSTVYLSDKIFNNIEKYSFYTVKHGLFNENQHVCKGMWSTFFMWSIPNGNLMSFLEEMFNDYCKKYDMFASYFLIDCMIAVAYEKIFACKEEIDSVPLNNQWVFMLYKQLHKEFNDYKVNIILEKNLIHKLSYKSKNKKYINNLRRLGLISND